MMTLFLPSLAWPRMRGWGANVLALAGLAVAGLALCGCSGDEAIRTYSVPKLQKATQDQETLGVIIPKETPWAFKLMGKPEKVELYNEVFRQLVNSLSFAEDGSPKWQLPDQWREEAGGQFVYRSLHPPGEKEIKVTVSQLRVPFDWTDLNEDKWHAFMAENVNRWRGQLNLSKQSWDVIAPQLETIDTFSVPKAAAYLVRLRGSTDAAGSGMGGMASSMTAGGPPTGAGPSPAQAGTSPAGVAPQREGKPELSYTLPEGWREVAPLSIMAIKSIEVDGAGGKKANVTFTAAGGDRESNVARWNGQVRGAPDQVAKALESSQKLTIGGAPAEVVELVGQGDEPQAILAAKIDWSPQDALFIKMIGPVDVVTAQREAFVAMLQSIKW